MVKCAWDYEWSSAAYHAGVRERDALVTDTDLLKEIDDWQKYLSDSDKDTGELRLHTRTGRPIGGEGFIQRAEKISSSVLRLGNAGRPRKK